MTAAQPTLNRYSSMLNNILTSEANNHKIEDDPMVVWDKGVFFNELQRQGIVFKATSDPFATHGGVIAKEGLQNGTYHGTQMALTEVYSLLEKASASHFDTMGCEPIMPRKRELDDKRKIYQWSDPSDGYPPHLKAVPDDQQSPDIFDIRHANFVKAIAQVFSFIPETISKEGTPYKGPGLADCEKYNNENPSAQTDIMDGMNLGNKNDWYSDARFAQQHLSGANPTTIETAPPKNVKAYVDEANKQGLKAMSTLLAEGKDLLIQDYSYFREATGLSNEEAFENVIPELVKGLPTTNMARRYACASVIIFQLHSDGRLHPLAITLDHRGSLDKSVTIFNRRLNPDDNGDIDEKDDWPWRYAKTCAQTADWARHEIAVHLVDTHMVEEAIIVATNRTIPDNHLLYEILSPHWYRTLALNFAARTLLVPAVITRIAGFGPTIDPKTSRVLGLVNWSYKNFNFQDKYIPNDLKKRGFDLEGEMEEKEEIGYKYRNYPYALGMYFLWKIIREFVQSMLQTKYKCDSDVQKDPYISGWCKEIQEEGELTSFPTITTLEELIDAVTMCIHIASPQHTAVNYLQSYYYSFVPSKPPALCTPLPQNLDALQKYGKGDLLAALPIGDEDQKWKDWLLAAQLPKLLSYKVETRYNLITYAKSLYNVNKDRSVSENKEFGSFIIMEAAERFYNQLKDLGLALEDISAIQTEGSVEYKVLQPELTAISILI